MSKTAVRIDDSVIKEIVEPYAKARAIEITDAVARLLKIGWSRHKALSSYAESMQGVKAAKAPKAPKAKKVKAAGGKKRASKKTKASGGKRASTPPLAAADEGTASAPASPASEPQLDDNFDPIVAPPTPEVSEPEVTAENALEVLMAPEPEEPPPAEGEAFDPFADFDKLPEN